MTGTRDRNDGIASLVTLLHYGLLDATGYDTGVIKSLNKKVLATSLAALRGEQSRHAEAHLATYDNDELKRDIEAEFSLRLGKSIDVTNSVGRLSPVVCAALVALDRANPLEATRRNLSGTVK